MGNLYVVSKSGKKVYSKVGKLLVSLGRVFEVHGRVRALSGAMVSYATYQYRRNVLYPAMRLLFRSGFRIQNVSQFRERHLRFLVNHWVKEGLSASTIQGRFSVMRMFCRWIKKPGMAKPISYYMDIPYVVTRSLATKVDLSWTGNNVSPREKINDVFRVDPRVAYQLELQWAFGLRAKESFLFNLTYLNGEACVEVFKGTKGRRSRIVPVETDDQRQLLNEYKEYCNASTGSLIPSNMKLFQWSNHFYSVMRKCGITKDGLGVTAHGLRHEYAINQYIALTGTETVIRAVALNHKITLADPDLAKMAKKVISHRLGHGRAVIADAYLGKTTLSSTDKNKHNADVAGPEAANDDEWLNEDDET